MRRVPLGRQAVDAPAAGAADGSGGSRRIDAAIALGLALAALLLYAPAARFDFVDYDDYRWVLDDPEVRAGLDAGSARRAFAAPGVTPPLSRLAHALDVELFGLDPAGHHWSSIALHALNALLFFAVLRRLTGDRWPSAFAAAVFAVHPLNVESVAWVAERKNVLSGCFFLLTLLAWIGWVRRGGALRYALAMMSFALGLAAKATLVTLPFLLLLLDGWPLSRLTPLRRRLPARIAEKLPLFALSAVASALTLWAQTEGGALRRGQGIPLLERLANAALAYATYLRRLAWPSDLAAFYPHPALQGGEVGPAFAVMASLILLAAVSLAAWRARRRFPHQLVGWCAFLGLLVPTLGIVQAGEQAMADRYMYLPMLGPLVMLAWGAQELARRRPAWRPLLAAGAALCIGAGAASASAQLAHWRDTLHLFERALAVTRDNPVALNNVAWLRATCPDPDVRDVPRALALATRAVEITREENAQFLDTLAAAHAAAGDFEAAVAASRRAVALAEARGWQAAARGYRAALRRHERGELPSATRGCPRS